MSAVNVGMALVTSACGLSAAMIVIRDVRARRGKSGAPRSGGMPTAEDPDLLSAVSHELRTPLTSIRGALDLVSSGAMGSMSDDVRDLVRIASENSERLINLVNDLIDVRKMDAGCAGLDIGPVAAVDLVREVVRVMEPIAHERGVIIDHVADDVTLFLDRTRMGQVLLNLTHNAVRHSPRRGVVSIRCELDVSGVAFVVDDEGPGIPVEKRSVIFDPYVQLGSNAGSPGSSGLGLTISQRIAAHHGGGISVAKSPFGGARFRVQLPVDCRSHIRASAS